MSSSEALPYSVSDSSDFGVFAKLQGAKNYATWRKNMCAVLRSLRQWGVVEGTVVAPTPADAGNLTTEETKAKEAWDVREIHAFMEIAFRMTDSARAVLGDTLDPKVAWGLLEKRFGPKQPGLKFFLYSKIQRVEWDGTGAIQTHRNYMDDLRTQLADAGMTLSDQCFYLYFSNSLPAAFDLFVISDDTKDVDLLCHKIARYQKIQAVRSGEAEVTSGSYTTMRGQQPADKTDKRKKARNAQRVHSNVTCFNCGKKGHVNRNCLDKQGGGI